MVNADGLAPDPDTGEMLRLTFFGLTCENVEKLLAGFPIVMVRRTHPIIEEHRMIVIAFGETSEDLKNMILEKADGQVPEIVRQDSSGQWNYPNRN